MVERAAERYVLLLESAYDNGKLCSFSHRAFRLWANSLSYARKHRTDGRLSPNQAAVLLRLYGLTGKDVDELVDKGGWDRVEDGYVIHDFLDVNVSEDQIRGLSGVRAEAGRRGGVRSGESRRALAHQREVSSDEKARAANLANQALRGGRLTAQPCERCGAESAEMHHADYTRPLDVTWLCKPCHDGEHVEIRATNRADAEAKASSTGPGPAPASEANASALASSPSPGASKQKAFCLKPNEADVDIDVDREEEAEAEIPTHGDPGETGISGAGAPVRVLVPVQAPHVPKARQRNEYPPAFEAWWAVYPNKEAKYKALESWRQRRKAGRSVEALQAAVGHLADYVRAHGTPIEKVPHATTFLNQRRDEGWEHGPPNGPARPALNGHGGRPQRESPMEQAQRRILAGRAREAS